MDKDVTNKYLRRFGIIFGIVLIIVGTIHLLRGNAGVCHRFYVVGILIFALGIFVPVALRPVYFVLKKILDIIREFTTTLVLLLLFYFVLTPIGLIAKLFGKNFLDIDWEKKANSYWIKKEQPSERAEKYERQF